jgi:RNA polymerase sigma factor for flagellar operon FliA
MDLVDHYLPLVVRLVRRLDIQIQSRLDPQELIGMGVVGLHQAIRRYQPESGVPFDVFAEHRIRGAIFDELRQRDQLTRPQRRAVRRLQIAYAELSSRQAQRPTPAELAAHADMSEAEVNRFMGMAADPLDLEAEIEDGLRYLDIIPDPSGIDPAAAADRTLSLEALRRAIGQLDDREQQLLYLRHDLELGVKEIAVVLRISNGRVSQIYNEIVAKLRRLMHVTL